MSTDSHHPQEQPPRGLVLGRIGGAPVIVAPSGLLFAIVIGWSFSPLVQRADPTASATVVYGIALLFALLLCVSVFLHELAHGLVARSLGVVVDEYRITLLGGHTQFGSRIDKPGASALISLAGPAVNALIGGVVYVIVAAIHPVGVAAAVLIALQWSNLIVALFNVIPGLPLDGGRALEAVVWKVTGSRGTGTLWAGWAGRVVALGVIVVWVVVPLTTGTLSLQSALWSLFIAFFLWTGANHAVRSGAVLNRVRSLKLDNLAIPAVAVAADATLGDAGLALRRSGARLVFLVDPMGRPVGFVDNDVAKTIPLSQLDSTPARSTSVAIPVDAAVSAHLVGTELVDAVRPFAGKTPMVAVVGTDGGDRRIVGALPVAELVQAMNG